MILPITTGINDSLRDIHNPRQSCATGLSWRLLQPRLDSINRGITQRSHRTGHQPNKHSLVTGQISGALPFLELGAEFRVGSEVHGLVGALAESSEGDTAVESADAFFADDGVEGVGGVAVLWDVEGVGHGVVLGLEADLHDFHGSDDRDGFGDTGSETSW